MDERDPLLSSRAGPDTLQAIADRAAQFNNEVSQLNKLADQLGSMKDSEQLRNQLRVKREDCGNLAKTTLAAMKRLKIDKSEKVKYDKIMGQINDIFTRYQKISKDSIQKERVTPIPVNSTTVRSTSGYEYTEENTIQPGARGDDKEIERGLRTLEYQSYNVDKSIIEERDTNIKFLESEMKGLNEMFVDIATMIKEQGDMVNTIEDNTFKASNAVEDGVQQLRKASEYQQSSRKKLCCLLLIVVLILAAIGAFIGIYFGAFHKSSS